MNKVIIRHELQVEEYKLELEIRELEPRPSRRTVNLEPAPKPAYELAIVGSTYRTAGQIWLEIRDRFKGNQRVQRICEIWERWHLTGMNAGTNKQNEAIEAYEQAHPDWHYKYEEACQILRDAGLYNDRGYVYGTAWLYEPLPMEIGKEIVQLFKGEQQ